jgi:hypothetical protein
MKRYIPYILIFTMLIGPVGSTSAQCNLKELKKEFSEKVKPYEFEGLSAGYIFAGETTTISLSVYRNQKYRLYFYTDGFDGPVDISVMTRNRFLLFSNKEDLTLDRWTFVPKKSETYFVEFKTPPSSNEDQRGCVAVVLSSRGY